jgi:predicted Rossmann fold nucleotide-binding protein DprA/Smf involved in DNA uptake
MNMMSEDAKAILLLCGHLGGESEHEPLAQRAYNQVVQWLLGKNLRPADLLSPERIPALSLESGLPELRLTGLLKRGVKLGFALEKWNRSGIWVICRSDQDYPARYKTHLKDKAPPILFGVGEHSLLKGGGLAMDRNKLIYALADYGLVVSADYKKGGTWAGAEEELKRKPGRPVFVRIGDSVPTGNRQLINLGALEFPRIDGFSNPAALFQETVAEQAAKKR